MTLTLRRMIAKVKIARRKRQRVELSKLVLERNKAVRESRLAVEKASLIGGIRQAKAKKAESEQKIRGTGAIKILSKVTQVKQSILGG